MRAAIGFFTTEEEESVRSLESLLRMCVVQEPSAAELYLRYVRQPYCLTPIL